MTDDRHLSSVIETWLAEGPIQMPDRVFDEVADRIARQRQRPAWRLDWRRYPMSTKFAAALAAVLVVAVVGGLALLVMQPGTSEPASSVGSAPGSSTPAATGLQTLVPSASVGAVVSTAAPSATPRASTAKTAAPTAAPTPSPSFPTLATFVWAATGAAEGLHFSGSNVRPGRWGGNCNRPGRQDLGRRHRQRPVRGIQSGRNLRRVLGGARHVERSVQPSRRPRRWLRHACLCPRRFVLRSRCRQQPGPALRQEQEVHPIVGRERLGHRSVRSRRRHCHRPGWHCLRPR